MKQEDMIIKIDDAAEVVRKLYRLKPDDIPELYEALEKKVYIRSKDSYNAYMDGLKAARDAIDDKIHAPFGHHG